MSWLRNSSIAFARQLSKTLDPRNDYEPQACFSSFSKHWQQAYELIQKSHPGHLHDDVLGVVNHLEQLSTLVVLEARVREIHSAENPAECLEYLLSENLLDKLYEWGIVTGKYENAVRFEQLKLYGNLIGHYSSQVIAAEPFIRPLLKLLSSFRNELPPSNVETQLVLVLNQLCVALIQNMKFIDLFFLTTYTDGGLQSEFIIVRLLLSSVHREGRTGVMARDALLLCAKMSASHSQLATYMLRDSNTTTVLATGLSGLYSLLPNRLDDKVYKLTPDDVNKVHKLMLFVDSLEFCNAVAQVGHPSLKKHLLDLLYQGFLVPVMGPALLQNKGGLQSGTPEQIAAMAYLELIVRCSTYRGLLRTVLEFLLHYEYDDVRVIDVMLSRLDGESQLSLVALSLMETLIDLNCEDVMLELVYKYLLNGHHLNVQHRNKISDPEPYREAAMSFLSLTPNCCLRPLDKTRNWIEDMTLNGKRILEFRNDDGGRSMNGVHEGIAMDNLVQEIKFNYGNPNETLFGNYHAYLCDARFEIISRTIACLKWTSKYDTITQPKSERNNNAPKEIDIPQSSTKEPDSLISVCTSGYETLKTSDTSEKEPHSLTSLVEELIENTGNVDRSAILEDIADLNKEHDSITSFGESSGYDSFRFKYDEDDEGFAEESFLKCLRKMESSGRLYEEVPLVRTWRASAESIIGPLLSNLLKKAARLLECDVTVNVRVTSLLSKLVCVPTPLLTSLLLCPHFVLQPNVPSLFQILNKLKCELDELTVSVDNITEYVDKARVFLIHREMALVKTRTNEGQSRTASEPQPSPPNVGEFRRFENKRKSISSSFSNMFGRLSSSPLQSSPIQHTHQTPKQVIDKRLNFTQEEYWNQSITLRSILNAVILDEWVKELAALSEEHALRLSAENSEDETYIRFVAL